MRSISSGLVQGPSVIGTTLNRYKVPSGVGYTHTIHPGSQRPFWVYSQDLKEAANNERTRKIHPIYSKCRQSGGGETYLKQSHDSELEDQYRIVWSHRV
jgi:hypothetical protein